MSEQEANYQATNEKLNEDQQARYESEANRVCETVMGMLQPPLLVYQRKQLGYEFWVCIVLTLIFWFPGTLYAFHVEGIPCCDNFQCFFIPPLGLYCARKQCSLDVCIAFALSIFTVVGGPFWAYYRYDRTALIINH